MLEKACGSARADTGVSGVNGLKVNNFSTAEPLCYIKNSFLALKESLSIFFFILIVFLFP